MECNYDDCFVLFVRPSSDRAGSTEWPLAACPTYADAQRIRRQLTHSAGACVIRYVGPAGGGD
jgi:hypothetical protein